MAVLASQARGTSTTDRDDENPRQDIFTGSPARPNPVERKHWSEDSTMPRLRSALKNSNWRRRHRPSDDQSLDSSTALRIALGRSSSRQASEDNLSLRDNVLSREMRLEDSSQHSTEEDQWHDGLENIPAGSVGRGPIRYQKLVPRLCRLVGASEVTIGCKDAYMFDVTYSGPNRDLWGSEDTGDKTAGEEFVSVTYLCRPKAEGFGMETGPDRQLMDALGVVNKPYVAHARKSILPEYSNEALFSVPEEVKRARQAVQNDSAVADIGDCHLDNGTSQLHESPVATVTRGGNAEPQKQSRRPTVKDEAFQRLLNKLVRGNAAKPPKAILQPSKHDDEHKRPAGDQVRPRSKRQQHTSDSGYGTMPMKHGTADHSSAKSEVSSSNTFNPRAREFFSYEIGDNEQPDVTSHPTAPTKTGNDGSKVSSDIKSALPQTKVPELQSTLVAQTVPVMPFHTALPVDNGLPSPATVPPLGVPVNQALNQPPNLPLQPAYLDSLGRLVSLGSQLSPVYPGLDVGLSLTASNAPSFIPHSFPAPLGNYIPEGPFMGLQNFRRTAHVQGRPIPKPVAPNTGNQQAYEAYIEWRRANEPGYALACKRRQQRRTGRCAIR